MQYDAIVESGCLMTVSWDTFLYDFATIVEDNLLGYQSRGPIIVAGTHVIFMSYPANLPGFSEVLTSSGALHLIRTATLELVL